MISAQDTGFGMQNPACAPEAGISDHEIDAIIGAVVELAGLTGVPAPRCGTSTPPFRCSATPAPRLSPSGSGVSRVGEGWRAVVDVSR
ncbi:hypothetical protein AB0F15_15355 [Amycolatopsis sp. NPDC026612]|uniref:hypothetical protein n=1 Tax=Amycolatopsis sp. NPDC026612 TaxID=3155466 RepID=UPI0033FDCBD3